MADLIAINFGVFLLFVMFFYLCNGIIGKIFWTLVFCGFTYINVTKFYPETLEIDKERRIAQEKLKDCEILRPNSTTVVYNCPEYTTTNVKVFEGVGNMSHTETYSTTINKR